jgi:prophage regulatory protein
MNDKNSRLIRLPEVKNRTGLGRSTIYGEIAAERFPAPIKISPRCVAWIESEVADWINRKISDWRTYPESDLLSADHTKPDPKAHTSTAVVISTNNVLESLSSGEAEESHGVNAR